MKQKTKLAILEALKQTNGKIAPAARLLGMGRTTLYRKLKKYNLLK
ncbi:helix-turn-helix domain-containing protein [Carboxydothermus ferrireducens]